MAHHPEAAVAPPSDIALFRYAIVAQVRVRTLRGDSFADAVGVVAGQEHVGLDQRPCRVSARTIYRWHAAFKAGGIDGLAASSRAQRGSEALDPQLVSFLVTEKEADGRASIPELLRRAVVAGLLPRTQDADRTTVWRALRRLGVRTRVGKAPPPDQRRFAKESRLQIVLCDGKHFRAGPRGLRRVALFYVDDATRYVPHVVVGPSETAVLFLRGLYGVLDRVGKMDIVYDDHGSAFIADDSHAVLTNLDIGFVHGTAGYPPGRGKIERFNRTAEEAILRDLARDDVDPDCTALELRLAHYLTHAYNRQPHESLGRQTPEARFIADDRPLRPYLDAEELRRKFFVREKRVVSNDHVISFDSVLYEVPRGLAGQRVSLARDVFDARHLRLDHEGQSIRLYPVDLHANARVRRGATTPVPEPATSAVGAARRAAEQALAPITDPDGGFSADDLTKEPSWT
jgi:transposase InsO family protein